MINESESVDQNECVENYTKNRQKKSVNTINSAYSKSTRSSASSWYSQRKSKTNPFQESKNIK